MAVVVGVGVTAQDPESWRLWLLWDAAIGRSNDANMALRVLEGDPAADPPKPRTGTDAEIAKARGEALRWWAAAEQRHRDLCLYVEHS